MKFLIATWVLLGIGSLQTRAQNPTPLSPLHVEGSFLVDANGVRRNLHGFAQTYSPWFNERNTKWDNYDVQGCLNYNKGIIDGILNAGWKMDFVRLHMDPYWSNEPGVHTTGEDDISAFRFNRFKTYLDQVFIPMAEYAMSKGLYVIMRPPGVCPEKICIGDAYHKYLLQVWDYVSRHWKLQDNGAIMFELANEPVSIVNSDGSAAGDKEMTQYMQAIVDKMRQNCNNILLIPGLGWQQRYNGFLAYPIVGENIGYAVHAYPGWYNSGVEDDVAVNYTDFKKGWDEMILPIATKGPVVVTEMDWAPKKYDSSWGKATTGVAGGAGFGANFKRIVDETRNVSWLLFTDGNLLAQYNDDAPDGNTFLTDPEACPRPCYRWYKEYATQAYIDEINQPGYEPEYTAPPLFSLTNEWFDPNIWEQGTFNENTGYLKTGQWGFGGWHYSIPVNLSAYRYLVAELKQPQTCSADFRLFDIDSYWSKPAIYPFNSGTKVVIDLQNVVAKNDDGSFNHQVDPAHIYYAGFWTNGSAPIYINKVYLSDDGVTQSVALNVAADDEVIGREYFTIYGQRIEYLQTGVNIVKETFRSGKTRKFKVCYKL